MKAILEKLFRLEENGTTVKREILAGLTTFSTMIYILFVNPTVLKQAGMDYSAILFATIVSSFIATIIMGLFANYPFALAPGIGLNAYFTYGVVLGQGYSWEAALGVCFISGLIFFMLAITGIREKILYAIPHNLRLGTIGGMGIFLSFIGCKLTKTIVPDEQTLLTLGNVASPDVYLTAFGVVVIATLMALRIKGAIFLGTLANWVIGLLSGLIKWDGLFSLPPNPAPTFFKLDLTGALQLPLVPVILSFVVVSLFDTSGTILALAHKGGFCLPNGKLPRAKKAFTADSIGTISGALTGTSPITIYLESTAGISAGGRTGLTACVVSFCFLIALFLSPFANEIPPFATAPALIVIGAVLTQQIKDFSWDDPTEFIPGFIIMITIPMTFSISIGIAAGFLFYALIKIFSGRIREVNWLVWIIGILFCFKFWQVA